MIKVKLYKNEDIAHALKKLRRKMQKENTLQELYDRKFFKSDSELKREAKKRKKFTIKSISND